MSPCVSAATAASIKSELAAASRVSLPGALLAEAIRPVGSALARHALDDLRGRGVAVLPTCPFIKAWIDHHPEYRDLLYNAPRTTATD